MTLSLRRRLDRLEQDAEPGMRDLVAILDRGRREAIEAISAGATELFEASRHARQIALLRDLDSIAAERRLHPLEHRLRDALQRSVTEYVGCAA